MRCSRDPNSANEECTGIPSDPVHECSRNKGAGLQAAFEALTPGRQRAYILYFTAPKQSKTRAARVEKYTPHILDGKGLND